MPGDGVGETMLLWPVVTPLGFLLLAVLIIVLGASSTAKYEFERNQAQAERDRAQAERDRAQAERDPAQAERDPEAVPAGSGGAAGTDGGPASRPSADHSIGTGGSTAPSAAAAEPVAAVGVATHPAGRHRVDPGAEPAWWLVDEPGEPARASVVAGPFGDRMDADWAALAAGLSESVQAVHGVQRADGGLARRQSPQETAWLSELGGQLDRLPEDWDELLTEDDALTTLVVEVAAALVEAGLPVHDCVGSGAAGGVCLTPGPHYGGVVVSWHQHERMTGRPFRGATVAAAVQGAMNAALADLLTGMGFEFEPFGTAGCVLVTDIRGLG